MRAQIKRTGGRPVTRRRGNPRVSSACAEGRCVCFTHVFQGTAKQTLLLVSSACGFWLGAGRRRRRSGVFLWDGCEYGSAVGTKGSRDGGLSSPSISAIAQATAQLPSVPGQGVVAATEKAAKGTGKEELIPLVSDSGTFYVLTSQDTLHRAKITLCCVCPWSLLTECQALHTAIPFCQKGIQRVTNQSN